MPGLFVTLIVVIILAAVLYWAVHQLAGAIGLSPVVVTVLDVLLVVFLVLYLLRVFGWLPAL